MSELQTTFQLDGEVSLFCPSCCREPLFTQHHSFNCYVCVDCGFSAFVDTDEDFQRVLVIMEGLGLE